MADGGIAPIPMPIGGIAPIPMADGGTAPIPIPIGGIAPIPMADGGMAPIPMPIGGMSEAQQAPGLNGIDGGMHDIGGGQQLPAHGGIPIVSGKQPAAAPHGLGQQPSHTRLPQQIGVKAL